MNARTNDTPVWRFLRADRDVMAPALRLLPDGRIEGSRHPNESTWKVEEGQLHFVAFDGRSSTVFDQADQSTPGRVRLRGRFQLGGQGGPEHVLEHAHPLAEMAIGVPEVVDVNGQGVYFDANAPRVRALLAAHKVFFGRDDNRFEPGADILIGHDAAIEPYACFPAGLALCTMGAFSYAESPLPSDLSIGRYCSIATGFDVFRDRHPMEWATSSSITYDCDGFDGYRSFAAAHRDFNGGAFTPTEPPNRCAPAPRISHDVWIGQHVQLARGISIGTGAVIAAGSIVTRDVPAYAVVAGVPAKVLRMRFEPGVIEALLASRWWEFDASVMKRCDYRDPVAFAEQVSALDDAWRWKPVALTAEVTLRSLRAAT